MYGESNLRGLAARAATSPQEGDRALRVAQAPYTDSAAVRVLAEALGPGPFALVVLFVTPWADFDRIVRDAGTCFEGSNVMACTTAGEIGASGYEEGQIVAIGFPSDIFATRTTLIENIDALDTERAVDHVTLQRLDLGNSAEDMPYGFAFMVVDGLSLSEDTLSAALSPALGDLPIFGGSAGDGTRFEQTRVALNGKVAANAAVLALLRSKRRMRVFSLDHLVPTERQMVVTEADPARRVVKAINAEPAAREYARIVGKDPGQLDRFTFAAHPVVVRLGADHHVRAIQQITDTGEMVFFSAVDEGMVLTVAEAQNLETHLSAALGGLNDGTAPTDVIGCDCILRRIEAEQRQQTRALSHLLASHNVTGFSTYGEQIGPLHVNHTMSGVAFYPADDAPPQTP